MSNTVTTDNNEPEVILIANSRVVPKPRFWVIVGFLIFGTVLLWNQTQILHIMEHQASNVCRPIVDIDQWPNLVIPPPPPVSPPIVIAPEAPSTTGPTLVPSAPVTVAPVTKAIVPTDLASIRDLRKFYLSANQADGKIVLRTGGTIPWRLNNPGMIKQSDFARQMGSIGSNGVTAIFPSYDIGVKALRAYLFTTAGDLHSKALKDVLPAQTVRDSGIDGTVILDQMTDDQKDKLISSVQKSNGFIPGKITTFADEQDWTKNGW